MEILTYKELKLKDTILPLLDHAFGWPYNPRLFEKAIEIDPRYKNGAVGFCAVEDDRVVGFVGVLELATRTLSGNVEAAGGIYGVSTLPSHVRRGISTALMNAAHEYFKDKGYCFSFLWTARSLVAHSMYRKLGYADLYDRPSAYKILYRKKQKADVKAESGKFDVDRLLKVYNRVVKGKAGFVVRSKDYFTMFKKFDNFTDKECFVGEEGYVLFKNNVGGKWTRGTQIRELVASDAEEMNRLVGFVEEKAEDLMFDRAVLDDALLNVYRSRGYMIERKSHSIIMAKPLLADTSINQKYGDKLYIAGMDHF